MGCPLHRGRSHTVLPPSAPCSLYLALLTSFQTIFSSLGVIFCLFATFTSATDAQALTTSTWHILSVKFRCPICGFAWSCGPIVYVVSPATAICSYDSSGLNSPSEMWDEITQLPHPAAPPPPLSLAPRTESGRQLITPPQYINLPSIQSMHLYIEGPGSMSSTLD